VGDGRHLETRGLKEAEGDIDPALAGLPTNPPVSGAEPEVPGRGRRLLERRIGTLSASSTYFGPFSLSTESEWCQNGASLGKRAWRRVLGRAKEG
jgi:hypothetical protein